MLRTVFNRENSETSKEPMTAKIMTVKKEEYIPLYSTNGILEASEERRLNFKFAGRIKTIFVKEGDNVKKNDKLVELETFQLNEDRQKQISVMEASKLSYSIAEEKWKKAKRNMEIKILEKQKQEIKLSQSKLEMDDLLNTYKSKWEYFKEGGMSNDEFSKTKSELLLKETALFHTAKDVEISSIGLRDSDILESKIDITESQKRKLFIELGTRLEKFEMESAKENIIANHTTLNSIERNLQDSILRATRNGTIISIGKHEGELVSNSNNDSLIILSDVENLHANFSVSEKDFSLFSKEQIVELSSDSLLNKKFHGKINFISPIMEAKTHSVQVKAFIPNENHLLKVGMFCRLKIQIGKKSQKIFIPEKAILSIQENPSVFIVKDSIVFSKNIEISKNTLDLPEDKVEITKGLSEGDQIIIENIHKLRAGQKIKTEINK
jgi:multidrug efflux pump subunit AcrA (membrane-fusion protein)